MKVALIGAAASLAFGCLRNIEQKSKSGKDYRYKGAKKIKLEAGEGRARDIVTYPGGDRVDWKVFEIPEGKEGRVAIKLKWRPPRPGGDLAFVVYDKYFHRVARAKPRPGSGSRTKRAKLRVEAGKYYIQIYAPRRMDAGKYTVSIRFRNKPTIIAITATDLASEIPDPPKLPAVPEPKEEPPPVVPGAPGTPGNPLVPPPPPPPPPPTVKAKKPVKAKVTNYQASSGGTVVITISKGKNAGVERGWTGKILRGKGPAAIEGGEFKVIKVTARECVAKVKLSVDTIKANRWVLLEPLTE